MREKISAAYKDAMKKQDKTGISTLRLITAAIKDKDIDIRGGGARNTASDDEILALLQKMIKQRQESAKIFADAGRAELAKQENDEIAVISTFLPQQMDEAAMKAAITVLIASTGAQGVKDMGKVMGELKSKFAGQMDFGKANAVVKGMLG